MTSDGVLDIETAWATKVVAGDSTRVYLVVTSEHRVVPLEPGVEVFVGRLPECAIQVVSNEVSRRHASFTLEPRRGVVVRDLGGRNGTGVGKRVLRSAETEVGAGEVCSVGPARFVIAIERTDGWMDAPAAPLSPPRSEDHAEREVEIDFRGVVVGDPAMKKVYLVAQRVAARATTALILGETGVGKEVLAAFLHTSSPRAAGPYVRLSCASLSESLLEAELFGYEKGAFTGADRRKIGFFEAASGGTLFLDEVGEISPATQVKVLRVLENRTITRIGGTQEIPVDVRVVCATHRDLRAAVAAKTYREDLYYRISAFTLRVPPLRERPLEIGLLAEIFATELGRAMDVPRKTLSPEVMARLGAYSWPGNVRELKNALEHALVLCDGPTILLEHLPETLRDTTLGASPRVVDVDDIARVQAALDAAKWNQTHAATSLGISRRGLIYKMKRYGLKKPG